MIFGHYSFFFFVQYYTWQLYEYTIIGTCKILLRLIYYILKVIYFFFFWNIQSIPKEGHNKYMWVRGEIHKHIHLLLYHVIKQTIELIINTLICMISRILEVSHLLVHCCFFFFIRLVKDINLKGILWHSFFSGSYWPGLKCTNVLSSYLNKGSIMNIPNNLNRFEVKLVIS